VVELHRFVIDISSYTKLDLTITIMVMIMMVVRIVIIDSKG